MKSSNTTEVKKPERDLGSWDGTIEKDMPRLPWIDKSPDISEIPPPVMFRKIYQEDA